MPRIAASLVVVVAVAAGIGFNTVRYPVVWEMVAVAHQLPQADPVSKPSEAEAADVAPAEPQPAAAAPVAAEDPAARPNEAEPAAAPRYVCTDGVCRIVGSEKASPSNESTPPTEASAAPAGSPTPPAPEPAETEVLSAPAVAHADPPAQPVPVEPEPAIGALVPVTRPAVSHAPREVADVVPRRATPGSAERLSAAGDVRRLPPVDRVWTPELAAAPLEGQPIYPTTATP